MRAPGASGVTMPIGPEKRSTGTTGPRLKKQHRQTSRDDLASTIWPAARPNSRPCWPVLGRLPCWFLERQRPAMAQYGFDLGAEAVARVVQDQPRPQLQGRAAALDALHEHAARRLALARVERQDEQSRRSGPRRPAAPRRRRRRCGSCVADPPGRAMAAMKRAQRSRSPSGMALAAALTASTDDGAAALGVVRADWRGRGRSSPRGPRAAADSLEPARDVGLDQAHARRQGRCARCCCGRGRQAADSRSTSVTSASGMRRATARPTTPTPAPTSSTRCSRLVRTGAAAASSTASSPAR